MGGQATSKLINIVGAGRSLCDLPDGYIFDSDTMALNVSTIAPQFYDMKAEKYHHSWTYAMFIDSAIGNKRYYPEYYYFNAALNNKDGVLYIPQTKEWAGIEGDNVRRISGGTMLKTVLIPALYTCAELGYDTVVLHGCDFCRIGDMRYWWETDDALMNHPDNRKAMVRAERETYRHLSGGRVEVVGRVYKAGYTQVFYEKDTGGNQVLCDGTYRRQLDLVMGVINELKGQGVETYKYSDKGMLEIPAINK